MGFIVGFDDRLYPWRVDSAVLLSAIHAEWPSADINPAPRGTARILSWSFEDNGEGVESYLQRGATSLVVDGRLGAAAKVAAWFRDIVPNAIPLIFCDAGYNVVVDVEPGVSSSELAARANI